MDSESTVWCEWAFSAVEYLGTVELSENGYSQEVMGRD